MKRIYATVIFVILVFTYASCDSPAKKTAQPFIPPDETVLPVEAFGTVKTADIREIVLPFPAIIEKLHVVEFQKVIAGDVLFTIDLAEYKNQITEKELEIKNLYDEIEKAQQIYKEEQTYLYSNSHPDIKKLFYSLINAKEELERMQQKLSVKESLFNANSISHQELTEFQVQVDGKIKDVKDIELSIDILKYQKQKELEKLQEALDQDKNRHALLTVELKDMKSKLQVSFIKESSIISGIENGIVSEIGYMPGAYVSPQCKILRIMNLDSLVIEANVDEQFISKVKKDAKVHILPEADRSHTYIGKVTFISAMANNVNGETTIPVLISIDNPDDFLLPNFNVEVIIEVDST